MKDEDPKIVKDDDGVTSIHLDVPAPSGDVAPVIAPVVPPEEDDEFPRGDPPCTVTDCKSGKPAHWVPTLMFYAWKGSVAAPATFALPMCDDCRDEATIDWFLTDEGYRDICRGFERAGKVSPVRKLTELQWKMIEDDEHPFVDTPFDPGKKTDG